MEIAKRPGFESGANLFKDGLLRHCVPRNDVLASR